MPFGAKTLELPLLGRYAPLLQETVVAERRGRPVLAVKAGAVSQVGGLVHDGSASGSSVFIGLATRPYVDRADADKGDGDHGCSVVWVK